MKFFTGLFVGLLAGMGIVLAPILLVAAFLAGGVMGMKAAERSSETGDDERPRWQPPTPEQEPDFP